MTYSQYKTLRQVVQCTLIIMEGQYMFGSVFGSVKDRGERHRLYLLLNVELQKEPPNEDNINSILRDLDLPELIKYNDFENEINDML